MKPFLYVLNLLLAYNVAAQVDTVHSYNEYGRPCKKEEAAYYRSTPRLDNGLYRFAEFYLDGKIKAEGSYSSLDSEGIKEGHFTEYDSLGFVSCEGKYVAGKQEGKWKHYYPGTEQTWYKENFKEGVREGYLDSYYPGGKLKRSEAYEKGEVVYGKCFDESGNEIAYTPFLQMPEFPGGDIARNAFLANNLIYPRSARSRDIMGRVFVSFTVYEDGSVQHIKITKSVHPLLDEESLRVVGKMPKWKPGKRDDKLCKVVFTLPIRFTLE